jgi:hypothetical protein
VETVFSKYLNIVNTRGFIVNTRGYHDLSDGSSFIKLEKRKE